MLQRGGHQAALAALDDLTLTTPRDQATRLAWRGQALRALGRANEGAAGVIQAIRIIKQVGLTDELPALRELHADLARSAAALSIAEAARRDTEALLAEPLDGMSTDRLLERAQAAAERGLDVEAAAVAQRVLVSSPLVRHQVIALLVLGRCAGEEHVLRAHELADDAGDQNLLTAVARTAKLLGVRLRRPSFG